VIKLKRELINLSKTEKYLSKTQQHLSETWKFLVILALAILMQHSVGISVEAPANAADKGSKRTIDFHSTTSLGALYAIPIVHGVAYATWRNRKMIGAAVGKVSVVVPPDHLLCLEPNRRLLDKPELMKQMDPDCLDALFISASSLDDAENQRCNQAMKYASHFKSLKDINVDRSDVSDTGLSLLQNLPSLEAVSTMLCDINGSCLPTLSKLPKLHALNLWGTHVSESNYKYFSLFKNLDYLNLSQTKMTVIGFKEIGKCTSLKELLLAYNVSFTDEMVSSLLPLKNLEKLDLRQTSISDKCLPSLAQLKSLKQLDLRKSAVTLPGLTALAPLHLVSLKLTDRAYSDLQIKQIRSVCAGAIIYTRSPEPRVDKDTMRTFAPLDRHGQL
jgi:hypothetical protein